MEEKLKEYRKSKQYKIHILFNVFLIILFALIVWFAYKFYASYNKDDITYNESKNYTYEVKENTLYLNSEEGIEQSYKCISDCEIYTSDADKQYTDKGKVLLKDGENVYLYSLFKNKKISGNYNKIDFIMDEAATNTQMFKINDTFGKQGIMDLNGTIIINLIYDELGKNIDKSFSNYSYERNYITARSGANWGLVSLTNGKGLIDFQYEDIRISKFSKFAVKESGLWYLVDELNKKIIPKGYESLEIHENLVVVSELNQMFVLDLLGNIMSNKVDIKYKVDPWATSTAKGLVSYIEDEMLYFIVDEPIDLNAGTYKSIKYFYNKDSKEIILKDVIKK